MLQFTGTINLLAYSIRLWCVLKVYRRKHSHCNEIFMCSQFQRFPLSSWICDMPTDLLLAYLLTFFIDDAIQSDASGILNTTSG